MKNGTTYRIRKTVIIPILNSGKTSFNALRRGINDVAAKETISIMIISVTIINDRMIDQRNARFFLTLKITFNAFSIEEKTGKERIP